MAEYSPFPRVAAPANYDSAAATHTRLKPDRDRWKRPVPEQVDCRETAQWERQADKAARRWERRTASPALARPAASLALFRRVVPAPRKPPSAPASCCSRQCL